MKPKRDLFTRFKITEYATDAACTEPWLSPEATLNVSYSLVRPLNPSSKACRCSVLQISTSIRIYYFRDSPVNSGYNFFLHSGQMPCENLAAVL